MGHDSCGAVKASFGAKGSAGSEHLDYLVNDIRPRIGGTADKKPSANFVQEGTSNAKLVAKDLVSRSKIVAEKVEGGHLKVVPALYYLSTGKVDFFER